MSLKWGTLSGGNYGKWTGLNGKFREWMIQLSTVSSNSVPLFISTSPVSSFAMAAFLREICQDFMLSHPLYTIPSSPFPQLSRSLNYGRHYACMPIVSYQFVATIMTPKALQHNNARCRRSRCVMPVVMHNLNADADDFTRALADLFLLQGRVFLLLLRPY